MIPIGDLWLFFSASLLLGLAPGPDNLFVLSQSALYGRRSGFAVVLGLCTGLLVHTSAVALGIAAIFKTSPIAFTLLKSVGACYLLWLAWKAFSAVADSGNRGTQVHLSLLQLYRRGIIMNLTNPKVSVFFLAFLPQFADPALGSLAAQIVLLGGIFIIATLLVFGSVTVAAGTLGERFGRSPKAQRFLNFISGVVFIGLALRLFLAK